MTNLYDFLEYYGRYADPPPTWHRAERIIREKYGLTEDHGPSHDALEKDGTPVEIKSCAVEYGDGRPGQFEIWKTQMDDLIPGGRVALLVYEPDAGHRVIATQMVEPVDLLYVGTSGWREHSTMGRRRICRIPWPEVFSLDEVTFWRRYTYSEHFDPEVCVDLSVAGGDERVAIRIEDDGPGLASNERAVLDGRSETPLEHGTGLGLWLANWIVTGLGGEIRVGDPDDTGTAVSILLHAAAPRADGNTAPTPSAIGLED